VPTSRQRGSTAPTRLKWSIGAFGASWLIVWTVWSRTFDTGWAWAKAPIVVTLGGVLIGLVVGRRPRSAGRSILAGVLLAGVLQFVVVVFVANLLYET